MALVLSDRTLQTGTANTTVSFTLSGSVTGYQSFAVIGNGNTTYYSATDVSGNWEVGLGTYSTTGPTLTRTTILASSNSGSAVTFSGTVTVFVTYPAEKSANTNAALTSGRVTYATTNGLLTDSAGLTFDGTNFATTGTATAAKLIPTGTSVTGNGMYLPATNSVGISTAGTNAVYIDASQNVGIGTSSPGVKLDVNGALRVGVASNPTTIASNSQFYDQSGIGPTISGYNFEVRTGNPTPSARMTVDSAGKVGIGRTPTNFALEVAGKQWVQDATQPSTYWGNTLSDYVVAYYDVAGKVGNFSAEGSSTQLAFRTNSTERMRIDSGGRVGIGCTPASTIALDVANAGVIRIRSSGSEGGQIDFNNSSDASVGLSIDVAGTDVGRIFQANNNSTLSIGQLVGTGGVVSFSTAAAERMRIDASGNVGIGTSSPTAKLHVNSGTGTLANFFGNNANNYIQLSDNNGTNVATVGTISGGNWYLYTSGYGAFYTGATERMRIDSSGYVGINTATPGTQLSVVASATDAGALSLFSNAPNGPGGQITQTNTNNSSVKFLRVSPSNNWEIVNTAYTALCMYVTNAGAAYQGNNSATWSITSDIRIKTNVRQIGSALDKMMALKPCHFEYKNAIGETATGFIAQEFEEVFPGHVKEQAAPMQFEQYIEGENKMLKTIDANLVPYLVKAIQELKAEFDAYKSTHP